MKGTFTCKLGTLTWKIDDKQVVVLKGENLKYERKSYNCLIRIDPPEEGLDDPVRIIGLSCKFATSTAFETELKQIAYNGWKHYLDTHPSVMLGMKRDIKIQINKLKLEQLQNIATKLQAQIQAFQATLNEINL